MGESDYLPWQNIAEIQVHVGFFLKAYLFIQFFINFLKQISTIRCACPASQRTYVSGVTGHYVSKEGNIFCATQ